MLLAACQAAPPSVPRNPALAPLPDSSGLTVMAVEGLPPAQAAAVALAMVDALGVRNIPAATRGANQKSRFVTATARIEAAPGGGLRVRVGWRLIARDGARIGSHRAAIIVSRARWNRPDKKLFRGLADGAAQRFAALIQAPDIAGAPTAAKSSRAKLHVWPVEGAPGGGNDVLRREMRDALRRHGHLVSDLADPDTLVISGWVDLGAVQSGHRALTVSWAVLDWRGRELGTLAQSKKVPAGDILTGWPRFAALIAEAAAGGVDELLRKSRARPGPNTPVAFTAEGGAGKVRPPHHNRPAPSQ
ncbi:MAG: hypothetical protein V3R85_00075 [Alphaproteobacteria bacterium]